MPKKKLKLNPIKVKSFVTVSDDQKDKVKGGASEQTNCFDTCIAGMCNTAEFNTCGGCNPGTGDCGGTRTCYTKCGETCDYGFQCLSIKPDMCTFDFGVC